MSEMKTVYLDTEITGLRSKDEVLNIAQAIDDLSHGEVWNGSVSKEMLSQVRQILR